jgi:hypothetical protein
MMTQAHVLYHEEAELTLTPEQAEHLQAAELIRPIGAEHADLFPAGAVAYELRALVSYEQVGLALASPRTRKAVEAVRALCEVLDSYIVLKADPQADTYLIATDSVATAPLGVEFQVSNGIPGERTSSEDYYDIDEALAAFEVWRREPVA